MRRAVMGLLFAGVIMSGAFPAQASDWDVFGKIMAGVEGLRVISGGKVDLVGSITGTDKEKYKQICKKPSHNTSRCVSIPENKVWKRIYIPEHEEYSEKYGEIVVEGHYIKARDTVGKPCKQPAGRHFGRYDRDYYSLDDLEEFGKLRDENIIGLLEFDRMKSKVLSREGQPRKNAGIDPSFFSRLRELKQAKNNGLISLLDYDRKKSRILSDFPKGGYCQGDACSLFEALYELNLLYKEDIIGGLEFDREKGQLLSLY